METCCRVVDLRCKEVINIHTGARLGYVCDVEIETCTGRLTAIVVPGCMRFFGLFGRGEDIVIPWCDIKKIGDDIILVEHEICVCPKPRRRERGFFF